jgi:hypothetical protein
MSLSRSQRILIAAAAAAGACVIAVPAAVGLSGNPTFSRRIPVRVPTSAQVITYDDHGKAITARESGDHSLPSTSVAPSRSAHSSHEPEPGDDRGSSTESAEDRGGHRGGDRGGSGEDGSHGSDG